MTEPRVFSYRPHLTCDCFIPHANKISVSCTFPEKVSSECMRRRSGEPLELGSQLFSHQSCSNTTGRGKYFRGGRNTLKLAGCGHLSGRASLSKQMLKGGSGVGCEHSCSGRKMTNTVSTQWTYGRSTQRDQCGGGRKLTRPELATHALSRETVVRLMRCI